MGYDYLTIRTFVQNHQIPLIGPRTSHEWFFIGPLFYWMFCLLMPMFNYSVLVGTYFFGITGSVSIIVCYMTIKKLYGMKTALITSLLLALSPLWVQMTRDARFNAMTALLFFPFYYFLIKAIHDHGKSLFTLGIILGVMFSFFPSPILLLPGAIVVIFIYRKQINKKYFLPGTAGFLIPNIPYLIYNAQHHFEIITNLAVWIPYRVMGFLGFYPKNNATTDVLQKNITSLYTFFQQSYLYKNNLIISGLSLAVIIFAVTQLKKSLPLQVLLIIAGFSYLGLFIHGDPPLHYYLVMYPVPIILLGIFLQRLSQKYLWMAMLITGYLLVVNLQFYFSKNWFFINPNQVSADYAYVPFKLQEKAAEYIAHDAGNNKFNLARVGTLDFFGDNYSLNYQYLLWNLGKHPDKTAKITYTIYEDTRTLPPDKSVFWIENMAVTK
jgi:4-amino-4-deoxy-L-arabinose transferase-like glycosyltransferase